MTTPPYTIHNARGDALHIGSAHEPARLSPAEADPIHAMCSARSEHSIAAMVWTAIAVVAIAAAACIAMTDGRSSQDEAVATAASVTDAQMQASADLKNAPKGE